MASMASRSCFRAGAQHVDMARELYDSEPMFREIDECCELLAPLLGRNLRQVLYPAPEYREMPTPS